MSGEGDDAGVTGGAEPGPPHPVRRAKISDSRQGLDEGTDTSLGGTTMKQAGAPSEKFRVKANDLPRSYVQTAGPEAD